MTCDVVIPARNAELYIAPAIASVLDQTIAPAHIIVVDDQSRDGTAAVASAFGDRVQIVAGPGRTAGAARNLGVRHSHSELIAFLDADDECRRERLASGVEALTRRPEAGMVFCDAEYVDASGRATGSVFRCPDFNAEAFLGQLFERNRVLSTSVAMVRRAAFDAAGGFDERLSHAEDYDLWLRMAGSGRIEHVPECLVSYRVHGENLSADRAAHHRSEAVILNKHDVSTIHAALRRTHGDQPRADLALSGVLFRMERYDEGESLLHRTPAGEGDRALRHFMLGNFAVKRDALATAAEEFALCLGCDATFAPAHNNLGVIAATAARRDEALEHFGQAAALRPGYSDPRRNLDALAGKRLSDLRYTLAPLRPVLRPD